MQKLIDRLSAELMQREAKGLMRSLRTSDLIDFASNDYLGMARSRALFEVINQEVAQLSGKLNGAAGSRLLSGNTALAERIERELADFFGGESALLFNSGYAANTGVLSAIPQRHDTIVYDELAHASIKDGARLSLAQAFSFRHNDIADLEKKLQRATGRAFIVVESIYSMDGDMCPLETIVGIADQYNATLIIDEAHSTGVVGPVGKGLAISRGVSAKIAVRIYTFGKAMGCHGACVAGSTVLKDYLVNTSRPFIYTTALPPHALIAISAAFRYLQQNTSLIRQLQENILRFESAMTSRPGYTRSGTAIQCVAFPGNEAVNAAALALNGKGFDVRPIRKPTVPSGQERIRVCLHAYNTPEEIETLAEEIAKLI